MVQHCATRWPCGVDVLQMAIVCRTCSKTHCKVAEDVLANVIGGLQPLEKSQERANSNLL